MRVCKETWLDVRTHALAYHIENLALGTALDSQHGQCQSGEITYFMECGD